MLSSSVQNSEGRGDGNSGDSFADPCQEFKEGFLGFSSGLPLVYRFKYIRGRFDRKKLVPKSLRGSKSPLFLRFFEFLRSKKFARKILP
jgi:hypothetical protein